MSNNNWLENWEHLPASAIPAESPLRVVAEKREANRRECEEEREAPEWAIEEAKHEAKFRDQKDLPYHRWRARRETED